MMSLRTKEDVISYLYSSGGLGLDPRGINPALPLKHARWSAQRILMTKLHQVESIWSLDALSEVLNAAVAFDIIATVYDDVLHQTLARQVVDKCVELYSGRDWKDKVPVKERDFSEFNVKMGTKQVAYGETNHFFTIYLMTWLPGKEGIIHTHGESACSFKFLSATRGAVNNNYELGEGTRLTRAFRDGALHKGYTGEPEKYHATLNSLDPVSVIQSEDLMGKKVAYIQDDIGAHRIDNKGKEEVHSIHIYFPAYEATWVFSDAGTAHHFQTGNRIEVWTYKEFLKSHPDKPPRNYFLPRPGQIA